MTGSCKEFTMVPECIKIFLANYPHNIFLKYCNKIKAFFFQDQATV